MASVAAIHQFLAGYTGYDAISNEARVLREIFRGWGRASEIYTDPAHAPRELHAEIREASSAAGELEEKDVAFIHLSIGSPVNDTFGSLACRKVLLYHNVTPSAYFEGLNPDLARSLARGRSQAAELADAAQVNLADSTFNARELEAMGFRNVQVLPLIVDLDQSAQLIDSDVCSRYADDAPTILFVGRCAPNKAIEDAIAAFALYQSGHAPNARFVHIGSSAGTETYRSLIVATAREQRARNVEILGSRPQPFLNALYAKTDLFLSMSEHEGFCVPLLESIYHDVPILAYDGGAVAETLDGSGVLFAEKDFASVAEMMHCLIHNAEFREAVLLGQRNRLAAYKARDVEAELQELLSKVL